MKYLLLILLAQILVNEAFANPAHSYLKAKKQYILEYTVFGIDECLSKNEQKLVVDKMWATNEQIVIGSHSYFKMLAECFESIEGSCTGESCIVSKSMQKRLEGVKHVEKYISKFKSPKSL